MPEPAAVPVEMHRETLVAGMFGLFRNLPSPQHMRLPSCCVVKGITFGSAVRMAPPSWMCARICSTCQLLRTDFLTDRRYTPIAMAPCHPARYNQSYLYAPAVSKPVCYITSARRGITRCHGTCPAIHGVIQVFTRAMQAVPEVLHIMQPGVQTT